MPPFLRKLGEIDLLRSPRSRRLGMQARSAATACRAAVSMRNGAPAVVCGDETRRVQQHDDGNIGGRVRSTAPRVPLQRRSRRRRAGPTRLALTAPDRRRERCATLRLTTSSHTPWSRLGARCRSRSENRPSCTSSAVSAIVVRSGMRTVSSFERGRGPLCRKWPPLIHPCRNTDDSDHCKGRTGAFPHSVRRRSSPLVRF